MDNYEIGDYVKIIVDDINDCGGFLKGEIYEIEEFIDGTHDNMMSTHKNGNKCTIALVANSKYPKEAELYIKDLIEESEEYNYLIPLLKKLNVIC